jgi:hypothetical protein
MLTIVLFGRTLYDLVHKRVTGALYIVTEEVPGPNEVRKKEFWCIITHNWYKMVIMVRTDNVWCEILQF